MNLDLVDRSLLTRLLLAGNPRNSDQWHDESNGLDYASKCCLTTNDIPGLIQWAKCWVDLKWIESLDLETLEADVETFELLPVTAWRALASLRATECVPVLLEMLDKLAVEDDDWSLEEYPKVFAKLGPETLEALSQFAQDQRHQEWARVTVADAIAEIAKTHLAAAPRAVETLIELMRNAIENPIELNSLVLANLLDLKVTSAAEAIEQAFAADRLDVSMAGNWEMVRAELGVEGLGLAMPRQPNQSLIFPPRPSGSKLFCNRTVFEEGELDEAAAQEYFETAMNSFAQSPEGLEAIKRLGDLGWTLTFLELGVTYLGVTVEDCTLKDAEEIVFDLIPRKVATEPASASEIVLELHQFWTYVHREFQLPNAAAIAAYLDDDAADALEGELSNESNFGMAKSLVTMGREGGFDMSTAGGLAEFMAAFNNSLPLGRHDGPTEVPALPKMSANEKRAFNKQRQKKLTNKLKGKKRR